VVEDDFDKTFAELATGMAFADIAAGSCWVQGRALP
jgi:hypothetical protein